MAEIRFSSTLDVNRTLSDFKEKLKHGYHVIKILENQLETARQNVSLLQGQIRLANETISNLRQHYNELDDAVSFVLNHKSGGDSVSHQNIKYISNDADSESNHVYHARGSSESERFHSSSSHKHFVNDTDRTRSPRPFIVLQKGGQVTVSEADNPDKPRSPYAQQLKQVLEALQDEDASKKNATSVALSPIHQETLKETVTSHCSCPDCVQPKPYLDHSNSCGKPGCSCSYSSSGDMHEKVQETLRSRLHDEESVTWKQPLRIDHSQHSLESCSGGSLAASSSVSHNIIAQPSEATTPVVYSAHCQGACCSTEHDVSHGYKALEKSAGVMHYASSSSPGSDVGIKRESSTSVVQSTPLPGHCDDKCKCHAFVNYARYGYQLVESAPGIPQSIQPISPTSGRRVKRPPPPLLPGDEPPHLKYTKVKRIDGSKLTAQKTIADFSKRRFHPYNPRYDLDLLIVPPPVPASELLNMEGCPVDGDLKSMASSKDGSVSSLMSEDGMGISEVKYIAENSYPKTRMHVDSGPDSTTYSMEMPAEGTECMSKADITTKNATTHDGLPTSSTKVTVKSEHVFGQQWSSPVHLQDISPTHRGPKFETHPSHIHGNHSIKLGTTKVSPIDNVLSRAETRYEQNGIGAKMQDTIGKAF